MYDGYKILYGGYTAVKNISEGSFDLHKHFLDALMEVSPLVKKYKPIAAIIECQQQIVRDYRSAYHTFREDKNFTAQEVDYISNVYSSLLHRSLQSIDQLMMITTSGTLRMSDAERLQAIDTIYDSVLDQLSFLRDFNSNTAVLSRLRKNVQIQVDISRLLNK